MVESCEYFLRTTPPMDEVTLKDWLGDSLPTDTPVVKDSNGWKIVSTNGRPIEALERQVSQKTRYRCFCVRRLISHGSRQVARID